MSMSVTVDSRGRRHLKPLDDFLKPVRSKPRVEGDGSDQVAAFLDRKIARQEREKEK
jgi:hypothetical protein